MTDNCCFLCRTPTGVCATKYQCEHHKQARLEDERRITVYRDPTGETAVNRIMRQHRKPRRKE